MGHDLEGRYVLYVTRHSLGAHVACGNPNKHESRLLRCLGKLPVPSLPFLTGMEKDPTRTRTICGRIWSGWQPSRCGRRFGCSTSSAPGTFWRASGAARGPFRAAHTVQWSCPRGSRWPTRRQGPVPCHAGYRGTFRPPGHCCWGGRSLEGAQVHQRRSRYELRPS